MRRILCTVRKMNPKLYVYSTCKTAYKQHIIIHICFAYYMLFAYGIYNMCNLLYAIRKPNAHFWYWAKMSSYMLFCIFTILLEILKIKIISNRGFLWFKYGVKTTILYLTTGHFTKYCLIQFDQNQLFFYS